MNYRGFTILTKATSPRSWKAFAVRKHPKMTIPGLSRVYPTQSAATHAMKKDIDIALRDRRAAENPDAATGVGGFVSNHPWLTFFLGLAALSAIVTIIRGRPQLTPPPSTTTNGTTGA